MKALNLYYYVILMGFLSCILACQKNESSDQPKSTNNPIQADSSISVKNEPVQRDTFYLNKVIIAYQERKNLVDYRDSLHLTNVGFGEYSMVPFKLDMSGDGVDDYVILTVAFHHVVMEILDGFTGKYIAPLPPKEIFFNRPYPEENESGFEFYKADIHCTDDLDELLIFHSEGCPNYSGCEPITKCKIYRYNLDSKKVELVFDQFLMTSVSTKSSMRTDSARYISISDQMESLNCIDTIHVENGVKTVLSESWKEAKVVPSPSDSISKKTFVFDPESNRFTILK